MVSEPAGLGAPMHLVVGSQNSEALKTALRSLRGMSNVPHGSPAQQLGRLVPSAVATAALPTVYRGSFHHGSIRHTDIFGGNYEYLKGKLSLK